MFFKGFLEIFIVRKLEDFFADLHFLKVGLVFKFKVFFPR